MKVKALSFSKGEVNLVEVEVPKIGDDEVLIQTKCCGICKSDINFYLGKLGGPEGVRGHEGTGTVVEVGRMVKQIKSDDKVTSLGGPAFAEFYKTNHRNVAKIPDDIEEFEFWISEPLACVVNGIRGSGIQIGDNVCVIGCGYMGLLLIQAMPKNILNNLTAIDINNKRLALSEKFGAENTINPDKEDPINETRKIIHGEYDVVIESAGLPGTIDLATKLTRQGGNLIIFGYHVSEETVPVNSWHTKGINVLNISPNFSKNFNKDFHDAVKLLNKGTFNQRPLITHRASHHEAEKIFKVAVKKPDDYIKGVITF